MTSATILSRSRFSQPSHRPAGCSDGAPLARVYYSSVFFMCETNVSSAGGLSGVRVRDCGVRVIGPVGGRDRKAPTAAAACGGGGAKLVVLLGAGTQ